MFLWHFYYGTCQWIARFGWQLLNITTSIVICNILHCTWKSLIILSRCLLQTSKLLLAQVEFMSLRRPSGKRASSYGDFPNSKFKNSFWKLGYFVESWLILTGNIFLLEVPWRSSNTYLEKSTYWHDSLNRYIKQFVLNWVKTSSHLVWCCLWVYSKNVAKNNLISLIKSLTCTCIWNVVFLLGILLYSMQIT